MIAARVEKLLNRLDEVEERLGNPNAVNDQKLYKKLTQEHAYLSSLRSNWEETQRIEKTLKDNRQLLKEESDAEFVAAIEEDIASLEPRLKKLQGDLEVLLVPPDPNDNANTVLEVRAGTGGDEAALFVGNCVRMFKLFADKQGWKYEELSCTPSDIGGFKEYVMVISGTSVYRMLQYEAGTHRVQRVPETETGGRVHTSAITVAVLREPDEDEEVKVDEKDLRIDTFRSSGAGGQHVNTTDSAVRLTHLPTGIVVECQQERSQHKNKEKAMRFLATKIAEVEREKKAKEMASTRASQVGSGDRSERVRTYNFSQNRLTDHRINYTSYDLDQVMDGKLDGVTSALVSHYYHEKLRGNS